MPVMRFKITVVGHGIFSAGLVLYSDLLSRVIPVPAVGLSASATTKQQQLQFLPWLCHRPMKEYAGYTQQQQVRSQGTSILEENAGDRR